MRKVSKDVRLDYLHYLKDLENELTFGNHKTVTKFAVKHSVSKTWTSFLIQKGIIYKDYNSHYRWNKKIPSSIKIVNQFRKQTSEYHNARKLNTNKIVGQQRINFKAERKKPIREQKIDVTKLKLYAPKQENNLGLIRRFLKWIY
jgi:aspartate-semialdehyde dehydrogenase